MQCKATHLSMIQSDSFGRSLSSIQPYTSYDLGLGELSEGWRTTLHWCCFSIKVLYNFCWSPCGHNFKKYISKVIHAITSCSEIAELKRALQPDKTQSQVFMALLAFKPIFWDQILWTGHLSMTLTSYFNTLQFTPKCCTFGRSGYKMKTSIRSMLLVLARIIVYAPQYFTMLSKYTN